jgi:protease IV
MNFSKTLLASLLALVIFFFGFLILSFLMLASLASLSDEKVVVKADSYLHLKMSGQIIEMDNDDPLANLMGSKPISLITLKEAIKHAANDNKIKGILIETGFLQTGFSTIEELRNAITEFKLSGKPVIAYAENYGEGTYYLASVADEVYMHPYGELEFNGLSIEVTFFKKLFDKLGIKPEVFRVGDFKSAVEPYMLEKMSEENRLQLKSLITDIYAKVVAGVAASRGIDEVLVKEISDNMLIRNGQDAMGYNFVDSLYYYDQLEAKIKKQLGKSENDKINFITAGKYKKSIKDDTKSRNEIAVIVAEGIIMPGEASAGTVGSDTFVEEIKKARKNSRVKAIVLRVNSPGGSFQASDIMWRELRLAAEEKPVIASMADVAASGGYYLAMACDTIVASPSTITGSIGIFSVLFDASDFLENKIGITFDQVQTGEVGDLITVSRPLNDLEKKIWQKKTDEGYEVFTGKAAQGRDMSVEDLKKVASGRVWTGSQAIERGLVDVLGDFNVAVRIAADQANLADDYRLRFYPKPKTLLENILAGLSSDVEASKVKAEMGEFYRLYQEWHRIQNYSGVQARLPFELHWN